jgi:hypothetical protein
LRPFSQLRQWKCEVEIGGILTVRSFIRLKGEHFSAQGNALGAPFIQVDPALKGRNTIILPRWGIQCLGGGLFTQGVALGCRISALRAVSPPACFTHFRTPKRLSCAILRVKVHPLDPDHPLRVNLGKKWVNRTEWHWRKGAVRTTFPAQIQAWQTLR